MNRIRYASRLAASLEVATGEKGAYRCPLCLSAYALDKVNQLTWDHFPPRNIGGRGGDCTLVCDACHKRWSPVDHNLDRLRKWDELQRRFPDSLPLEVRFTNIESIKGMSHRAALRREGSNLLMFGRDDANPPEASGRLVDVLDNHSRNGRTGSLEFTMAADQSFKFSGPMIERAFLKAAYLAVFDVLGYPYILSTGLGSVRQLMHEPDRPIEAGRTIRLSPQASGHDRTLLLWHVVEPEPLMSVAVAFVSFATKEWYLTFLPVPSREGRPDAQALRSLATNFTGIRFLAFDRDPNLVLDPELVIVDERDVAYSLYPPLRPVSGVQEDH